MHLSSPPLKHLIHRLQYLVAVAAETSISCLTIDDLVWSEIDDPDHLKRAKEEIYPMVIETDLEYLSE